MKLPNKKIIIITAVIGIFILISLSFLLAKTNKQTSPYSLQPTPDNLTTKHSGPPIQTSLISFQQKTATSSSIIINTGGKAITGIQLEIGFDSASINNISIKPGKFFQQAQALLNKIDYQKGSIFYALAIPPTGHAKQGTGEIATLYYSFNQGAFNPTIFQFLPKTKVSAVGIDNSTLKAATPITVASSY